MGLIPAFEENVSGFLGGIVLTKAVTGREGCCLKHADATGGTGQDGPQEHRILPAALGMLLTHRCSYTSEAQRSRNKGKEGSVYTSMNMHAPSQSTVLYRKESGSRISEAVFPRKRHAGQVSMCYPVRKRTWARAENGHAQQREMDTLHCRKLKMDIPT